MEGVISKMACGELILVNPVSCAALQMSACMLLKTWKTHGSALS